MSAAATVRAALAAAKPPRGKLFAARGTTEWDGLDTAIAKAVAGAPQ